MLEYRCTQDGLWFYDPVLGTDIFAPNTLLFLIGYCRVFGDIKVSDKLFIPSYVLRDDGKTVALTNTPFLLAARSYLTELAPVEVTNTGDLFELNGLSLILEGIGCLNYYKCSTKYQEKLNRVPHVPLFTKRSQDYKRIKDILTINDFWCTDDESMPDSGINGLYTVYNKQYKGDRAEAIDLYQSFGSYSYINNILYRTKEKPVGLYSDSCSWFVWDSLAFTQLYQFSLGVLYGMSQLGWGLTPYSMRPTEYNPYFKYLKLVDEAFFWFQNTPFELTGSNALFNIDPSLFRIDTYPLSGLRVGITMRVDADTVVLRSKFLWGHHLQLSYDKVNNTTCSYTVETFVYSNISNSNYAEEIVNRQLLGKVVYYINDSFLIAKDKFSVTNAPEHLSGYPSFLRIECSSGDFIPPMSKDDVLFIADPKDTWDIGDVIDLPEDLYSLDNSGNIIWNQNHPLYSYLYGKEFSTVPQETETVVVFNSSMEELEIQHSLVTDLYYYNDEWITEEELNAYGWYVDRDIRLYRALSSTIDQEIQYSMVFDKYSVDGGESWMDDTGMQEWLSENNAEIVTDTLVIYEGATLLNLPASNWDF